MTSLVGSGALSLEGTGVGAGVQIGIVSNTTKALIETSADVKANSHVTVKANSDERLIAASTNAGIGDSNGVAGSVAIYDVHTDTHAAADDLSQVDAGGNVSITATGTFSLTGIAGSIGVGGTTGAGAANTTLLHDDEVQAWVGTSAKVITKGPTGLTLKATSTDDIIGVTAAGAVEAPMRWQDRPRCWS